MMFINFIYRILIFSKNRILLRVKVEILAKYCLILAFLSNFGNHSRSLFFSWIALQSPKINIHGLYHGVFKRYLQKFDILKILDFMRGQTWNFSIKHPNFGILTNHSKSLFSGYIAFQSPKIHIHGLFHSVFKRYLQNFDNLKILDFTRV